MKLANLFKMTSMALAVGLASQAAIADALVTGKVQDTKTKTNIQGARVTIKELNLETTSGLGGVYSFPNVKTGSYTIHVEYLGYQGEDQSITVADETINAIFDLKPLGGQTEEMVVYGQAGTQASAINRQRNADTNIAVWDASNLDKYADQNTAEALQRLSGVSIERDQGEGRFVRIRGLNPDLNSVRINGINLPSADSDSRAVPLDIIPSDLLESVEVVKVVTPDMDGDSVGGAINVKSLSAFDRDGLYIRAHAEGSYNELREKVSPKAGFTISDVIGEEQNFGVAFSSSWYNRKFGSDNVETGGGWDIKTGELEEAEQRHYDVERRRWGTGLNLDYRPTETTELHLRTLYSYYSDTEQRHANVYEFAKGTGEFEGDDGELEEIMRGIKPSEAADETAVAREFKDRKETQKILSVALGGSSIVDAWTIDYTVGYSEAREDEAWHIDGSKFESSDDFENVGFTHSKQPNITGPAALHNPANFELDEIELAKYEAKDQQTIGQIDAAYDFDMAGFGSQIKFGSKLSVRHKQADEDVAEADIDGDYTLADFAGAEKDYSLGKFGPGFDQDKFRSFAMSQAREIQALKSAESDYTIDENITAAYAMFRTDIDNLRLIGGVRYEYTDYDMRGNEVIENDDIEAVNPAQFDTNYGHWLPGVHALYRVTDNVQIRGAYTKTIARPTFEQMSPATIRDGDEVEKGNPNLKALESNNIDLSVDFYPGDIAVISAGLFYKDLSNFIYESFEEVGDNEVNTWHNGDSANLYGIELAYSQAFDFGLILGANATFIDSDATVRQNGGSRSVRLPGQSERIANINIGYEMQWISLNLAGVYQSGALLELDPEGESGNDVYEDETFRMDFVATSNVWDGISVYFKATNLTDEPYYTYQGSQKYNNQYEKYGRTYQLGVQYTTF
ncbi:Uncharacterised protein [BD1-7 clade bacterium]|uniref:TonB-dependent receptor n=1 Tax=BD1-7 clade bacterium TaxID=2029982 RepID=A0A5S9Q9R3_9GAMM|nr:Uncharacterised protein [BD1-7 clade bacterium]